MNDEMKYLYWLNSVEGIGYKALMILKKFVGRAMDIYDLSEHDLSWFLNKRQLAAVVESRRKWDVDGEFMKLKDKEILFYPYGYAGYPEKLKHLADPPAAIYVRGRLPELNVPVIAVIGTRKCSGYGSSMAKQLGIMLAERGIQVVSGMARGIDGIGQWAVCEAGGATFAVLGCGVLVVYPPENRKLYEQIIMKGGILSEYSPWTAPKAGQFPARNRIISGLSDALVVVEAKEKSGTMITVDMALEQGRDVYAMPGRLVDGLSCGCNRLIKQGAGLIVSLDEFVEEILVASKQKIVREMAELKKNDVKIKEKNEIKNEEKIVEKKNMIEKEKLEFLFTEEEKQVYSCLDYIPRPLGQIKELCPQISYENLLRIVINFCLKGIACQMGAGSYCRNG